MKLNKIRLSGLFAGFLWVWIFVASCSDQETRQAEGADQPKRILEYEKDLYFLRNAKSDTIAGIQVALADTPEKRNTGLMNIDKLPAQRGMLFLFDEEEPRSFWMANTPVSLDIIFVSSERKIVRIHHSTKPYAETNYRSDEPAQYVVEVNGGFCVEHDIREGMSVIF